MRATARLADVSFNTVAKLLIDAGKVCADLHDELVQGVTASRIQCDEIWAFTYAKQKNVATAKAAPSEAGDTWTWTALDSDSKLIVSWLVGGRDGEYAISFMDDLRSRLANRVQLTTDGHKAYLEAVEGALGPMWTMPSSSSYTANPRARRAMSANTVLRNALERASVALKATLICQP